jgi:hypothetical protein
MLYAELTTLYCLNKDIPTYASKFRSLLIKLRATGAPVPYDQAEIEFYRGLPPGSIPDKNFNNEDDMINYVLQKYGNKFVNSKLPSKAPSSSYPPRPYARYNAMEDGPALPATQTDSFQTLEEEQYDEEDPSASYDNEDPTLAAFNPSFRRGGKSFSRGRGPMRSSPRPQPPTPSSSSFPPPSTSKQPTLTQAPRGPAPGPCPRCRKPGHWALECPNPTRSTRMYPLPSPSPPHLNK